MKTHYCVLGLC